MTKGEGARIKLPKWGATCLPAMAGTVNDAERRSIKRDAVISFLAGHIFNLSANFLRLKGNTPVSDACMVAMELGSCLVLKDDWKQIWDQKMLDTSMDTMLYPEKL